MGDDVYQRAVEERDALRARLASLEARLTTPPQPNKEAPMTPEEPIADRRRRLRAAASYQPDAQMDALRQQLDRDPSMTISPQLRIQLGLYESARAAASAQQSKENRR